MGTSADPERQTLPRQRRRRRFSAGWLGGVMLVLIAVPCFVSLPWSITRYDVQELGEIGDDARRAPSWSEPMGSDGLGRSLVWRCLLGGSISLGIGFSAALISLVIGVSVGALAGYAGGRIDAVIMRGVDVLYGLPYVLLVVLLDMALTPAVERLMGGLFAEDIAGHVADIVTLLIAIGGVSWLTLARVIRGQVLSLRSLPFVEAARAAGAGPLGILTRHLLPNLIGPIVVYTTLTIPTAVLLESFLSFLGIGVQAPLPSWGNLAAKGVEELATITLPGASVRWWLPVWPCLLLAMTLMGLNFVGDALRDRLDPRKLAAGK
jgi:oligopeptide transport system permease protein